MPCPSDVRDLPSTLNHLQPGSNPLDSNRPINIAVPAEPPSALDPLLTVSPLPVIAPLPDDPTYLSHTLARFSPLLDQMGLTPEQRSTLLSDLSQLAASALDDYLTGK